jgi:hypothetical protein
MDVSGQLPEPGRITPRERAPVYTKKKAELAPELVWTLWRKDKFLVLVKNRNLVVQIVAIPTETSWLPDFSDVDYLIFSHIS